MGRWFWNAAIMAENRTAFDPADRQRNVEAAERKTGFVERV